jgi:hypothetical protein
VNEAELKAMIQKWHNEWHEHGVTIMCDSWTGPTRMSVINFLLYSNGRMELTLVDVSNPIREWMERARSTVQPELDEESPETDAPIPSAMVTATADPRDLQCCTG